MTTKGKGGTGSQGKRAKKLVTIRCRRCGRSSYHVRRKVCSACGFGKSTRLRSYSWCKK